jgi:hypothetical protein
MEEAIAENSRVEEIGRRFDDWQLSFEKSLNSGTKSKK